jgi:RNA polymerase sigma factor (sigma-70 family)
MAACHAGARVAARARVTDDLAYASRGGRLARPGLSAIEPATPRAAVVYVGSAPTFETSILPHLDAAYDLALWLTRDSVEAEDTVQDACLRALRYFRSFRGENGRAWLLKIVRNTAYARLRSRNTVAEVALGNFSSEVDDCGIGLGLADPNPGPEAALSAAQEFAQLKAVMSALPIDLRECLILREMREFTYQEIASITDVSIGTVMSRLYRARRLLMASWNRRDLSTATAFS